MAQTVETTVHPLWRGADNAPRRKSVLPSPRMRRILAAAALLTASLASAACLLTWFVGQPDIHFVSCWITQYRAPTLAPNTAAEQDRLAIQQGAYFARMDVASMPVHSRYLMRQQLEAVADSDLQQVVLYVGTYATVDALGRIVLLSSDFEPGRPETGLPLVVLLETLAKSRSKHKLLVLDIFAPCNGPGLDAAAPSIADALAKDLDAVADPNRLVLCACSPGQTTLQSESLKRTVFGYYFEQALLGNADGYNARGNRDGRVTVREVANMLRARVDRWARQNRAERQIPMLLGSGEDFELTTYDVHDLKASVVAEVAKYPKWLSAGWKLRDQWLHDNIDRSAPRTFKVLEANLLRIERKWRFGSAETELKRECDQKIHELEKRAALSQQQVTGPAPVSLAALMASGHQPDGKVVAAVAKLLRGMKTVASSKLAEQQATWQKLLAEFDKQTKGSSDVDIGVAAWQSALASDPLTGSRLAMLVRLLEHRQLHDRWVESHLLSRLAKKASSQSPPSWSAARAMQLLRIAQRREELFSHSETIAWLRPILDAAAQASHSADTYYWNSGFVPSAIVDQALQTAQSVCDSAVAQQAVLVDAKLAHQRAMRALPWCATYVSHCPAAMPDWEQAVDATNHLSAVLKSARQSLTLRKVNGQRTASRASAGDFGNVLTNKELDAIQQATQRVGDALEALLRPFSPGAVHFLVDCCRSNDARPEIVAQVDALLATPLLRSADRVALWSAQAALARRLCEGTINQDHRELLAGHQTAVLPGYDANVAIQDAADNAVVRQTLWFDLLRLAGVSTIQQFATAADPDQGHLSAAQIVNMSRTWAVALRQQITEADTVQARVRLSNIFPPFAPMPLLDQPATNPAIQALAVQHRALWAWLADWYRYETLDGPAPEFTAKLASQYAPFAGGRSNPSIQITGPTTIDVDTIDETATSCLFSWSVGGHTVKRPHVTIDILNPGAPWLKIRADQQAANGQPRSPLRLSVSLQSKAQYAGTPSRGFMVRWNIDGRSYHRTIEVPALANQHYLDICLSNDPKAPTKPLEQITLRPDATPQPFYLFLRNRGMASRKVNVQLSSGTATAKPVGIGAGKNVRITFAPSAAAASHVGTKSNSRAGGNSGLPPLRGPLEVIVTDAENGQKLTSKVFPVQLMEPRQYVCVDDVRFFPSTDEQNRLEITLRQRPGIASASCSVSLDLSSAEIPGLMGIGDGVLHGTLPADGKPLTLVARNLLLADSAPDRGRFSITVDGVPRTFVFETTFARGGDPTTPVEAIQPTLKINAPRASRSGSKFVVHAKTTYAPINGCLEVQIGRQIAPGKFSWERTSQLPGTDRYRIGFSPAGKAGALLFDARITDWEVPINTTGVVGRRLLRVRLLASNQRELAVAMQEIELGNRPPQGVRFIDIPAEAAPGQTLALSATARQSVPGVSRVIFFLGKPVNNAIPKKAVTAEAVVADATPQTWSAQLPLAKDAKGATTVSVQFTNAAGLSSFATATVQVSNHALSGGIIHGSVVEGSIPQRGLEVILKDEHAAEKGKTKTAANGSFTFENVKPGKYEVSAQKPTSGRRGSATVTVHEDTTTEARIELWL